MSIEKSNSWKNNGKFIDSQEGSSELISDTPSYNEVEDLDGLDISEDTTSIGDSCIYREEESTPFFNTNFYLDKDMYDSYKSDEDSKLKYLSSTSAKEDNLYVKLALTFMVTLLILGIINLLLGNGVTGPSALSIFISCIVTFIVSQIKKRVC